MEQTIFNAKITNTRLGMEDHGNLTFILNCRWGGDSGEAYEAGYGCTSLGYIHTEYDEESDTYSEDYISYPATSEIIMRVLEVVGVDKWEQIKDKAIRIQTNGKPCAACQIVAIGNIFANKWFNVAEFYAKKKQEGVV